MTQGFLLVEDTAALADSLAHGFGEAGWQAPRRDTASVSPSRNGSWSATTGPSRLWTLQAVALDS
jgi:hypothetical protein